MATATNPSRVDPKVLHPLDRLKGTIRTYVVIEGLLSAAIFVSAWFALGIAFDFGLFKLFTWDWVLDASWYLRGIALSAALLLLVSIVVLRIAVRLTKDLSYPSLALVLERKFPKILGDRLITAVELADVDRQKRYGYSCELILQTIEEARERVATVPVNEVFNWKRLRNMAALAIILPLLTVVTGFIAFAAANKSADPVRFGWKFAHVTGTFLERDILLRNVPWPRRAHIELVGFPDSGDLRIGKDAGEPTVRAKAYRWVVADRDAPMGWRPLRLKDVTIDLLGEEAPQAGSMPAPAFIAASEGALSGEPAEWDVDTIQTFVGIEDKDARERLLKQLSGPQYEAVQKQLDDLFAKLEARAAQPSMGRRLRKLDVPGQVGLSYAGASKTGEVTLGPQKNQEFASPISDLKESIYFTVRAEDFRTPSQSITLVPPPAFTTLSRTEYQPAYLHHTPPDYNYSLLKGKRQKMNDKPLSLTGDRSVFSVPSGTELDLTAVVDTELAAAYLLPKVGVLPGAIPGSPARVPVPIGADGKTVVVTFADDYRFAAGRTIEHWYFDESGALAVTPVTSQATLEFDLVVEQADGVPARRQIMIQVQDDQPPVVEIAPDVIRKIGNVYYVTPKAKIPFNPESYIRDDHGLSKVAYEYTYWTEDSDVGRALRAQLVTRGFLYGAGPLTMPSAANVAYHIGKFKDLDKGDQRKSGSAELSRYIDERGKLEFETVATLDSKLAKAADESQTRMVTKLELKTPDRDFFNIKALNLLASVSEVQTRYRLDLNVLATDANYDTGPKTGTNAEPLRLLIVSEGELLNEINKEEDVFTTRLEEALAKIRIAKGRLATTKSFYGQTDRIEDARIKMQDANQEIAKSHDTLQTLVREYRRLYRECQVNDVKESARDEFGKFANKMDRVCGETPPPVSKDEDVTPPSINYVEVERRLEVVSGSLNANRWGDAAAIGQAELGLLELERLVLALLEQKTTINNKNKLKADLEKVIRTQEEIGEELKRWAEDVAKDLKQKSPKLGTLAPTFMTKGETKRMKHTIAWRQFDGDSVVVKLTALDKDKKPVPPEVLGFPAELKLEFEKNELSFEYDLKAGAKEGDFTLTLTPAVGDPITISVSVK